ncbi:MAG: T9SS type A sorting domain-containing protein, partial [Chitinophagaceae bacterium]|nr:T9SS type A sorting domain-containing protein [Chitinophagaceae bacterium]
TWTPQNSQVSNDPYLAVLVAQESNATNQRRQKEKTVYIKVNPGQANGLNELTKSNITAYPNPAQHTLRLDFNMKTGEHKFIQIVNMDGRVVYEQTAQTQQGTVLIDVQTWANGLYAIRCNNELTQIVHIQH